MGYADKETTYGHVASGETKTGAEWLTDIEQSGWHQEEEDMTPMAYLEMSVREGHLVEMA